MEGGGIIVIHEKGIATLIGLSASLVAVRPKILVFLSIEQAFSMLFSGKEFSRFHNLQGHMHMHQDSKPHVCLTCGATFTLKGKRYKYAVLRDFGREMSSFSWHPDLFSRLIFSSWHPDLFSRLIFSSQVT